MPMHNSMAQANLKMVASKILCKKIKGLPCTTLFRV
jgi:hypothetical protein